MLSHYIYNEIQRTKYKSKVKIIIMRRILFDASSK